MKQIYVDESALDNCYATGWSYGEICVGCNCCGRFDKKTMNNARLEYLKEQLSRVENFDGWATEYPELLELQKRNIAEDIIYYREAITKLESEVTK